jgi:hypothetical protein
MSKRLKYYDDEDNRHAAANRHCISEQQAVELIDYLCRKFKFQPIHVCFTKGVEYSYYLKDAWDQPKLICFEYSMLNTLTVAHEFAHYAHHVSYTRRAEAFRLLRGANSSYGRERAHGPQHRAWVDKAMEAIVMYLQGGRNGY